MTYHGQLHSTLLRSICGTATCVVKLNGWADLSFGRERFCFHVMQVSVSPRKEKEIAGGRRVFFFFFLEGGGEVVHQNVVLGWLLIKEVVIKRRAG